MNLPTVATRLSAARRWCDVTQPELAKRMGVTHAVVCQVERGNKPLTLARLQRIADALGLTPGEIVRGEPLSPVARP